ncbi:serine hydrolase domain-containing protein [Sphingopyxis panaciterrulae]|uniref:CubicO group peptidase (Beta-lactamase class C family) n=1 Tax=Sphingopyxis panaciterrulae TaxID=462372 RepID=A0A7W9B794_9SPHN|nr:serine hydrolase [Sphingopyxis panaciterrulae]MBB5707560.1 CubicO group peptidase (beta-lactamase class C family) [Sphingopyxis panaciterrulae]
MITKKALLASGIVAALGLWSLSQAAGQGAMAPATPAPRLGLSIADARAGDAPRPLPALDPAVKARADALFTDADAVGETRALLVLRDGKLIYERYGAGFGPDSKLISWSMAKSITAVLAGFMVADGRLSLDGPAPVAAWQRSGDPRGAIRLRDLLHMASGLDHVEEGDPVWASDTVTMLFGGGAQDMAGFAEAKPAVARPGEVFNYSSATSVILSDILADTLTPSPNSEARREAMRDFIAGRLIEPLGMTSLTPEFDAKGTMIGGSIMHATARDYAKFGEFLRHHGVVNGQRLLPESWMRFMLTPSANDAGYGGHIWLNRSRPAGVTPALWPDRGPNDLFACIGHQGQYIIVSPSQRVTIVRLGITKDDQFPELRRHLADLQGAL